jgi:DNA gyrase subunit B
LDLGSADSALEFDSTAPQDGKKFEGDALQKVITLIAQLEEPLETLERRGIELSWLAAHHPTPKGFLPRYRVHVGRNEHWFADKEQLDKFLADEEAKRGEQFEVADDEETVAGDAKPQAGRNGHPEDSAESRLQVVDLHEVRVINKALTALAPYGITLKEFIPAGHRNGEPIFPHRIRKDDATVPLSSLRELLPKLRKIGEHGRRITRFKGLGEMDAADLWETSMDPARRVLLQVTMEDAAAADEIFRVLMGDHVEPRRDFIEKHALDARDLDV